MRNISLAVMAAATFSVALFVFGLSASPAWADPNLSIEKEGPARVQPNQEFTYTIRVENTGPDAANTVVVTDELPEGVTLVSVDPPPPGCTSTDSDGDGRIEVTCTYANLAPDARRTIELRVEAPNASGQIENRAFVDSNETDREPSNLVTTTVASDLAIRKLDDPDPVREEGLLNYTLRVTNEGSRFANNVVVVDDLPLSDVDFVRFESDDFSCNYDGGLVRCTGSLASDETGTVEIVVEAEGPGTIQNTAEVRSGSVFVNRDTEETEVEARNPNPDPDPDDPDDPDNPDDPDDPPASPTATDTLDCDDFATQAEAQANVTANPDDPNNLIAEGDTEACEDFDFTVAAATDTDTTDTDTTDTDNATDDGTIEAAKADDVDAAAELNCVEILDIFRASGASSAQYQYDDLKLERNREFDVFDDDRLQECLAREVIDRDAVGGKRLAPTGGAPILPVAALVLAGVGILVGRSVLFGGGGGGSSRDD